MLCQKYNLILFRTKIISGQENTQPLKVDTMAKDKGQMTSNDLPNTTKNNNNKNKAKDRSIRIPQKLDVN
jgi:hypothetical protein